MDYWFQILFRQWYRTLSTHEIKQYFLTWTNYVRCIIVLYYLTVLGFRSAYLHFTEQSRLTCSKMSSIWRKYHRRLYYYTHFLISQYLPHDQQINLKHVNNNTLSFYKTALFLNFRIHVYQISQISTIRTKNWA